MPEVTIRNARPEELGALERLFRQELELHRELLPERFADPERVIDGAWLERILESENQHLLVARFDEPTAMANGSANTRTDPGEPAGEAEGKAGTDPATGRTLARAPAEGTAGTLTTESLTREPAGEAGTDPPAVGEPLVGLLLYSIVESPPDPLLTPRGYGYIDEMVVAGSHRNRGVGRLLLDRALAHLAELGIVEVELEVWEANREAWGFFGNCGFKPLRRRMICRLDE